MARGYTPKNGFRTQAVDLIKSHVGILIELRPFRPPSKKWGSAMKLKYLGLLTLLVSTSAICQTSVLTSAQRVEGETMVRKAGAQLANTLRDTNSAKFRNVFLQKSVGRDGLEKVSLCGEVNSTNGYGGMSGFQSFMLVGEKVWIGRVGTLSLSEICNSDRITVDGRDYTPELRKTFDANAGG
jgi:hypothetical protein